MASKDRGAMRRSNAFSLESAAADDLGDRWASLLNGVEVWAVARQVEQLHSGVFEALADACDLVGRLVIDDDGAAGLHFRDQALFEPLAKDRQGRRCGARMPS